MSDFPAPQAPSDGLHRCKVLFLYAVAAALGSGLYFLTTSQDLSDLRRPMEAAAKPRDLTEVLRQAVKRNYEVTLTEAEINGWLASQSSRLKEDGDSIKRVWVRFPEKNAAELVLEKDFFGKSYTISMFIQFSEQTQGEKIIKTVEIHGGTYHPDLPKPLRGGQFGKLVVPQGFMRLVFPSFVALAGKFSEEIHLGFEEMTHIRVENHRIILDPRVKPSNETILLPR